MARLFLGLSPDATARRAIGEGHARIEAALAGAAAEFKWTRTEYLHVTLHFLGEVPASRVDAFRAALGAPLPVPPFTASVSRFGAFPERGAPRVIWLGIDRGADVMARLHAILADRLRQLGHTVEDREFTPHFTLARARDRHGHDGGVRRQLGLVMPPAAAWQVAEATLFQTDLSGAAPRYEPLVRAPLEGRS